MAPKKTRKGFTVKQKKKISLATKKKISKSSKFRSFEEAREFVAQLGLQTMTDWFRFSHSGTMPPDIPHDPDSVYKKEWTGWTDWLGKPYSNGSPYVTSAQLAKAYPDALRKTKDGVEVLEMKYLRGKKSGMEQLRALSREFTKAYTIGTTKEEKLKSATALNSKKQYEESLVITSELVQVIDPVNADNKYNRHETEMIQLHRNNLFKLKSWQDALKFAIELAKDDTDGINLFYLGLNYHKLGKFDDAITTYLSSIERNPNNISSWYNLACSYACLKQAKKACNAFLVSIAISEDHSTKILEAKNDPDFDGIRNNPSFKKIISSHWRDLF